MHCFGFIFTKIQQADFLSSEQFPKRCILEEGQITKTEERLKSELDSFSAKAVKLVSQHTYILYTCMHACVWVSSHDEYYTYQYIYRL